MEFTFNTQNVKHKLAQVKKVVSTNNVLPILADVHLDIKEKTMIMTTSDSEVWLSVKCAIESCDEDTKICVNARDFLLALNNLDDGNVRVLVNEKCQTITCDYGRGQFVLPYDDASDFPMPLADMSGAEELIVDGKSMLEAIEKGGIAAANDELRPILNGIHFDFLPDAMVATSTDTQKMVRYRDVRVTSTYARGFTLPKKPASVAMLMLDTVEGGVKVSFTKSVLSINNTQFKMTARLLEGNYPDCNRIIPVGYESIAKIEKNSLVAAIRRVLPMSVAGSELLSFSFGDDRVEISAQDFTFSKSASETVECKYEGIGVAIGFNGSILLQILQAVDSDIVTVELRDSFGAGVFYGESKDTYVSIVMPMVRN